MSRQTSNDPSGSWKMILLLLIIAGAAALMISPVSADTGVTIAASGMKSYYQGEKVVFSGHNYDSDTTYLFITGPGVFMTGPGIPSDGGKLTSPRQEVVSGNPGSFDIVKTNPDKSWEYVYYTHNLNVDAGTYTIYAVSQPKTKDQLNGASSANVGIILKKPFITAAISPSSVSKGQPFMITGSAEGEPPSVQIWIIGDNYLYNTTVPVNPDASFTFHGDTQLSGKLPKGQCYLIVQHSMQNNTFDIVVSGDYVRSLKLNNGTNLFRISGPGSLQGSDAADAFIAAFSDQEENNGTYTSDTYTLVPFQVTEGGSVPVSGASAGTGITITPDGDHSYYQGEKVVLRGQSPDADTVYLFMTGPNLPATGGKLTSPSKAVISSNPDTFTVVKTKPDKSWEYVFYTANLQLGAGTYSVYAVNQPKTEDQMGPDAARVGMALKKPFITAEITPATVSQGVPFTVSGVAEGIPPYVQIWILGKNYYSNSTVSVNSDDASFRYVVPQEAPSRLTSGQYFLIVQHPMADNQFDFVVSGEYVRSLKLNNGTNLFRISGPGSLQGSDAVDALIAAISNQEANDKTLTSDTYTLVPFQVTDAGGLILQEPTDTTAPVPQATRQVPLQYAVPIGAGALLLAGIVLWKWH